MHSLTSVADRLQAMDESRLSPIELRTLLWSRCALAALYGIRVDEMVREVTAADLTGLVLG